MAFLIDKEELQPGLVIFRRGDVAHRNFYCRFKIPNEDRYKTVSLKTPEIIIARQRAWEKNYRFSGMLEVGHSIFNYPFADVAKEYLALQKERRKRNEISESRVSNVEGIINGPLKEYVGSTQVHLIGHDSWEGYPAWRKTNGQGKVGRGGERERTEEERKAYIKARDAIEAKAKARRKRKAAPIALTEAEAEARAHKEKYVAIVSDATILTEMSVFSAVMNYAVSKKYVSASHKFGARPKLKKMRREALTVEEYRRLHTIARKWIKDATRPASVWTRNVVYNFILIMCNTGMRPPEAKNLRWRDITPATDKEGREIVVLFVRGKGKQRNLVAPKSVGDYFERIREATREYRKRMAKEGEPIPEVVFRPDDPVFTTVTGKSALTLYEVPVTEVMKEAKVLLGPTGIARSAYCFRHTYGTFRLQEGVGVYPLAEQMGTSVQIIEDHYGHVNTIKHASLVLQGMEGWDPLPVDQAKPAKADAKAKAATSPRGVKPKKTATSSRGSKSKKAA